MQNSSAKYKKKLLTKLEYSVTQQKNTEPPYSGKYYKFGKEGSYVCKVCDVKLFNSENKYDSGSGWPSFDRVVSKTNVRERIDTLLTTPRTEVSCAACGAHLGHVFDDGPKESTGKRYCINSVSLDFVKKTNENN